MTWGYDNRLRKHDFRQSIQYAQTIANLDNEHGFESAGSFFGGRGRLGSLSFAQMIL